MLRIIIYAFPMIVNFVLGGMFFITAYHLSEAKYSATIVTGTMWTWASIYCISSLFMGRITNPRNAGRLIMAGAAGIGFGSLGFLFFPGVASLFILIGVIGVASAMYCTPFQVFMKTLEPDQNAGVVRSTALYTASWSFGMATGPLAFGLLSWNAAFILTALLGFTVMVSIRLIDVYYHKHPVPHRETPPALEEADYSKMPDYAWVGWVIGGCGSVAVSLVRTLIPYRGNLLEFTQAELGVILAIVSIVQGVMALALLRGKFWMYRPQPLLLAGGAGGLSLLLFAFGTTTPVFYIGAVLYGMFSGCCYFYLVFHSLVHPSRSSRYVSVNEITVGVACTLGPILGGWLTKCSSAGTTFFAAALMLLIMSLFCARVFQLRRSKIK